MAKTVGTKAKKVRVAIIGVGNCASSLVQGVEYYKAAPDGTEIPGIMHTTLGGYHIGDVDCAVLLLHEVAAGAVPRRRSARQRREVHQGRIVH